MYDAISFTRLQRHIPARNSRKSTLFSRKHRRCRLAPFFVYTRGIITRMAAQKDNVVDFDWVANKEELEEVLCVLAGSDPENCSYSRVSRGRVPADSFCIRCFTIKMRHIIGYKHQQRCNFVCTMCICFRLADIKWVLSLDRALGENQSFTLCFPKFFHVTSVIIFAICLHILSLRTGIVLVHVSFLSFACFTTGLRKEAGRICM